MQVWETAGRLTRDERVSTFMNFVYLQFLDFLTTIAFLLQGVGESNPIVRWAIRNGPNPVGGLFLLKLAVIPLALYCLYRSRVRLLKTVNIFFGLLVVYNLCVLILSNPAIR